MKKSAVHSLFLSAALCALAFILIGYRARGQDDFGDLAAEIAEELAINDVLDDLLPEPEPALPDQDDDLLLPEPEPEPEAEIPDAEPEPEAADQQLDIATDAELDALAADMFVVPDMPAPIPPEPEPELPEPEPEPEPEIPEPELPEPEPEIPAFEPEIPEPELPEPEPELPELEPDIPEPGPEPVFVEPDLDLPAVVEPIIPVQETVRRELDPRETEIVLMKDSEELRRLAYERHARESIAAADRAFRARQYHLSTRRYQEAINALNDAGHRAENEPDRLRAQVGLRESIYEEALDLLRQGDYENSTKKARQALQQGHPLAGELLAAIQEAQKPKPEPPPPPKPQRWKQDSLLERERELAKRLVQARELILTGELDRAQQELESIMKRDPYNTEAIRLMEKVARRRDDIATMELEYTRRYMIADVRKTWARRDYAVDEERRIIPEVETTVVDERVRPDRAIMERMRRIEIPEIDFRQANIHDVISFLQGASVEYEQVPEGEDPDRKGVNIILNLGVGADATPAAAPDPFAAADPFADPGAAIMDAPGAGEVPLITFSARYISLYEALRIVTEIAGLKFRIEGNVVMIVPLDAPDGDILYRTYDVMGTFTDVIPRLEEELRLARPGQFAAPGDMGFGDARGARQDLQEVFRQLGVPWPAGSSIRHVPSIGKLLVANTANNLALFEDILAQINVVPNQIEIEARFVEVRQTDMMSLGFEWGLTDHWQIAHRTDVAGGPGLSGRQHIMMRENMRGGGFSKGMRFTRDSPAGELPPDDVFTIATVLTNPELAFTLHMLQQKGNMDLLSAPKVTTQGGQEATIKVVTEYIYPTSFNVVPITAGSGDDARIVGGIVEPSSFETREVGVILAVVPDVSAEGNLISLTMTPEVVTEPMWKNYGSRYIDPDGNEQILNMEQPFFHTRTVTTQIMIFNGATVVMGGMINEHRTDVDDKIPFLGDLPLIGRLFRSRYETSEKRNLLIFVTARLVDPAGRPIQKREPLELAEEQAAVMP